MAGLLTRSFCLAAFPKVLISSGIMASIKSSQQRELSGISTRFPIEPFGTINRCKDTKKIAKDAIFLVNQLVSCSVNQLTKQLTN